MLEIGVIIAVALIVFGIGFFVLRKMPEGGKKKVDTGGATWTCYTCRK